MNLYINYYKKIGYKVTDNTNIEHFENILKNKITVLAGQSGAGKSSLLNKIEPHLELKTDDISYALNRGKHTTRHTELFKVLNGFVVDTPGFSQIDFQKMTKEDIRDNMKEMFSNLHYCKYRDCMHIKEDGCEVKKLVENKEILATRYKNYQQFIESIK